MQKYVLSRSTLVRESNSMAVAVIAPHRPVYSLSLMPPNTFQPKLGFNFWSLNCIWARNDHIYLFCNMDGNAQRICAPAYSTGQLAGHLFGQVELASACGECRGNAWICSHRLDLLQFVQASAQNTHTNALTVRQRTHFHPRSATLICKYVEECE